MSVASAIMATEKYIRRVIIKGSSQPGWYCSRGRPSSLKLYQALVISSRSSPKLKAQLGTHNLKPIIRTTRAQTASRALCALHGIRWSQGWVPLTAAWGQLTIPTAHPSSWPRPPAASPSRRCFCSTFSHIVSFRSLQTHCRMYYCYFCSH